jgi:hypothetical protein
VLDDFGPVKIKNISTHGVGLIAPEAVPAGVLLVFRLVNPAKKFSKTALMRVIHVTPQSGKAYLVAGNLETPLTYEGCNQSPEKDHAAKPW